MYVEGWLCFSAIEKLPSVEDTPRVPAVHSPLITQGQGANWSQGRFWSAFMNLVPQAAGLKFSCFLCLFPGGWGWSRALGKLPDKRSECLPTDEWRWVLTLWWAGLYQGVCLDVPGFRKSLGSLSADGWRCVSFLLVGWAGTSQHWSLQAIWWSQVLVPKWWLLGELMPINTPQYLCHSVLFPTVIHSHPSPPQETFLKTTRLQWNYCFCPGFQCA